MLYQIWPQNFQICNVVLSNIWSLTGIPYSEVITANDYENHYREWLDDAPPPTDPYSYSIDMRVQC